MGVSQGTVLGFGDGFGAMLRGTVAKRLQTCQDLKYPHEGPCKDHSRPELDYLKTKIPLEVEQCVLILIHIRGCSRI